MKELRSRSKLQIHFNLVESENIIMYIYVRTGLNKGGSESNNFVVLECYVSNCIGNIDSILNNAIGCIEYQANYRYRNLRISHELLLDVDVRSSFAFESSLVGKGR